MSDTGLKGMLALLFCVTLAGCGSDGPVAQNGRLAAGSSAATPMNAAVALTAQEPTGGTPPYSYQWHMSTANGFTPSASTTLDGASALIETVEGLTNDMTYFFRLVASDADNDQVTYAQVSATPSAQLLPGIASATAGDRRVTLAATPPTGGTPPYTFEWHRATTSGFTPAAGNALSGVDAVSDVDSTVINGTTYFYRLVASDADDAVVTYAEVSATPAEVSNDYPNRPAGMTEIITFRGDVEIANGDAFGDADFGGWLVDPAAPANMIEVVADPTNPTGSGSALRFRYSEQFNPRSGIATANSFAAGTFRRLYIKLWMFYEEGAGDWTFGHKIFYVGAPLGSRNNTGSPTQSYNTNSNGRLRYHQQNVVGFEEEIVDSGDGLPRGSNSSPVARGRWVMLEHVLVAESVPGAGDGQAFVFVDGQLVGARADASWVSPDDPAVGFTGMEWYADVNAVPGGDVFYRLGELYVAGD